MCIIPQGFHKQFQWMSLFEDKMVGYLKKIKPQTNREVSVNIGPQKRADTKLTSE